MGRTAVCMVKKFRSVAGPIRGPPGQAAAVHPDDGNVVQHPDADGGRPIGQLIQGSSTREVGCQHQDEEAETNDPVQAARGWNRR